MRSGLITGVAAATLIAAPVSGQSFVNWESGHVHPLDVTPSGAHVLAVNTGDNRLEVYAVDGPDVLTHVGSIPVGLEPVSVRARTAGEAWVVNHISDSVSVVDLVAMQVSATIPLADEPGDLVFAQDRAFVSVGTDNQVWVYDLPYDPATPPQIVNLEGDTPRALATDGQTVYAAIFNAGNRTTVLNHAFVTNPAINPYPGAPNPPPNDGTGFKPPINPALLIDEDNDGEPDIRLPRSSMILEMADNGDWVDDNGGNWSAASIAGSGQETPWWTLHGHALAHIDASSLAVSYTNDLMTINTALDVGPGGAVAVVGIHCHNHIRFEPNLNGRFVTNGQATVNTGDGPIVVAINPHLMEFQQPQPAGFSTTGGFEAVPTLPPGEREASLGDPHGVAISPGGGYRLITGRGSNNVVKTNANGTRLGRVDVGEGPTGVEFHTTFDRVYVLNKHDASISILEPASLVETDRVSFYDATPAVIRTGRKHLYDTHLSSGLGTVACASCHVNGANDLLAWDLGDPSGEMKEFNQTCIGGSIACENNDWHPMKGPMTTQTLFGIVGTEPLHWRGDREDLAAFNGAFVSLLAGEEKTDEELQEFEDFVATLTFPPNPYRLRDGSLSAQPIFNGGRPYQGQFHFLTAPVSEEQVLEIQTGHLNVMTRGSTGIPMAQFMGGFNCVGCHSVPTGSNSQILRPFIADTITGIHHLTKTAQLRDQYRKTGFDVFANTPLDRGFGYLHDGSFDTLQNFLLFFFGMGPQKRLDVEAFLFSFGTDTHAGVGSQATLGAGDDPAFRNELVAIASTGAVGLVVKGVVDEARRGYYLVGDELYQSDRGSEIVTQAFLDARIAAGDRLTWTMVAAGSEQRIGVDRDEDGFFDRDEIDACANPADPTSTPETVNPACCEAFCADNPACCSLGWSGACAAALAAGCDAIPGDADGNGLVDGGDLVAILLGWGACAPGPCPADLNGDDVVDVDDLMTVMMLLP